MMRPPQMPSWRTTSHDGPGAAPIVQGGAYSDGVLVAHDVDLEGVPWEIEEGMRDKVVIRYDQWKKVDSEEVRRGEGRGRGWGGRKHTNS